MVKYWSNDGQAADRAPVDTSAAECDGSNNGRIIIEQWSNNDRIMIKKWLKNYKTKKASEAQVKRYSAAGILEIAKITGQKGSNM